MLRAAAALICASALAVAQEPAAPEPVKLRVELNSVLDMKQGESVMLQTKTLFRLDYSLSVGETKFEVRLDRLTQELTRNGQLERDIDFHADGAKQGSMQTSFADAPKGLQRMLEHTFRHPLCIQQVDADRRDVRSYMLAKPGASDFVNKGMLNLVLFFHAPFPQEGESWTARRVFTMGGGDSAEGELTYTRGEAGADGRVTVKVKGRLKGHVPLEGPVSAVQTYDLEGTQVFDPKLLHYTEGELQASFTMDVEANGQPLGQGTGTATVKLARRD